MHEGRTLAHFDLIDRIGSGGMGDVWRARDTRLNRDVALKILCQSAEFEVAAGGYRWGNA